MSSQCLRVVVAFAARLGAGRGRNRELRECRWTPPVGCTLNSLITWQALRGGSEQNAVEGGKRPRRSGDEAMGKVYCRDCMAGSDDERDGEGLAKQQRAKRGEKREERAGLIFAKIGAGRR